MTKKLTIAFLTFNSGSFLKDALRTVIDADEDLDIIIADDASTDDTHEIILRIVDDLSDFDKSRVCYYRNEKNIGTVLQFLNVATLCRTEYIKPIDCADPFILCDFSKIIDSFESSNADVVFTRPAFIKNDYVYEDIAITKVMRNILSLPPRLRLLSLYSSNNLVAPSAFHKTDFIKKIIPRISNVKLVEDWPMWLRGTFDSCKFYYLDSPFVAYRIHPSQNEKSSVQLSVFSSDYSEIESLKTQLIYNGGNYFFAKFYYFISKLLNKSLCHLRLY